jgi:hypothetical protein
MGLMGTHELVNTLANSVGLERGVRFFHGILGYRDWNQGHLRLSIQGIFTRRLFNDGNITDIKAFR